MSIEFQSSQNEKTTTSNNHETGQWQLDYIDSKNHEHFKWVQEIANPPTSNIIPKAITTTAEASPSPSIEAKPITPSLPPLQVVDSSAAVVHTSQPHHSNHGLDLDPWHCVENATFYVAKQLHPPKTKADKDHLEKTIHRDVPLIGGIALGVYDGISAINSISSIEHSESLLKALGPKYANNPAAEKVIGQAVSALKSEQLAETLGAASDATSVASDATSLYGHNRRTAIDVGVTADVLGLGSNLAMAGYESKVAGIVNDDDPKALATVKQEQETTSITTGEAAAALCSDFVHPKSAHNPHEATGPSASNQPSDSTQVTDSTQPSDFSAPWWVHDYNDQ